MKYRIVRAVEEAVGAQAFIVDAESPLDAAQKFEKGEGELEHEDLDVLELSEVSVDDIEEVEDE